MSKKSPVKSKLVEFKASLYEKPGLSVDEVQEVKDAFDLFDTDKSGAVSVQELIEAMQSLGLDQKSESVFNMIKDIDTDGSGELEFGEFLEMMTATLSNKTSEDDLRKVFNIFDSDRTGEISLMNLKKMSKELGEDMPFDELAEMIDRNDLDGDGRWSFEDFSEMITNKNASKYNRARAMAPVVKVQIRWEGKMNINKKWQEIEVDHMKIDQDGMMTGVGNDDEGKYEVTGTIKSDATVKIEKRYIGAHTYAFEGKIDKDGKIKGQWTVSNDDKQKGDFELRPTQAIWNGQFTEGKRKNSFSFVFAFVDGAAYGHGVDASGAFSIMGTQDSSSSEVTFNKMYYDKKKVQYKGTYRPENHSIAGTYSNDGKTWEAFELAQK